MSQKKLASCKNCGAQYKRSANWWRVRDLSRGTEPSRYVPVTKIPEGECPICRMPEGYEPPDHRYAVM